jgi:methionyl aminopeptidase
MEDKEEVERTIAEVGAASQRAIEKARDAIKSGVRLLEIANIVEGFARESGFGAAFPVNLSVNSEAAHYTPCLDDDRVFTDKDLVKVDFGAAKDGYLGDCALSVDLSGDNAMLVEGVEDALSNAISAIRDGVKTSSIGGIISKAITARGGKPIRNLGGHGVERYDLHAGLYVPNYDDGSEDVLKEGMVVAIEPFATTGRGLVTDGDTCEIFSYGEDIPVRSGVARQLLREVIARYPSEPFAARWLSNVSDSKFALYAGLQELVRAGALEAHPTLVEVSGGLVAQAEAMVLVEKGGCRVLTK